MARVKTLTAKERAFAQGILDGMTKTEAYRQAYPASRTWRAQMVTNEAHDTSKRPAVAAFIKGERARLDDDSLLTRIEKRKILAKVARKESARLGSIEAIKVDNQMTGDCAPQKVEVFGLHELLALVRSGK